MYRYIDSSSTLSDPSALALSTPSTKIIDSRLMIEFAEVFHANISSNFWLALQWEVKRIQQDDLDHSI